MIRSLIAKTARWAAWRYGWTPRRFVRLCHPDGAEYAEYLRRHGDFASIGDDCVIQPNSFISDPYLTWIGNNVYLTKCQLIAHDGSIAVLSKSFDASLDSVGPIRVLDNVFVGHEAVVLPGVTIGENSVVGVRAVVTKDVPPGSVVGGVPARVIGDTESLTEKLERRTADYPWADLLKSRKGGFDPAMEPALKAMRTKYFFPEHNKSCHLGQA